MSVVNAHWRDSSRNARFFGVDAYAVLPVFLMMLHMSMTTFLLVVFSTLFFSILERFDFTVPVFFRWFRNYLAGPYKTTSPWWRE